MATIQSIDELQRVRLVQRAATSKAALELNGAGLLEDPEQGRANIVELLRSYAFQPSVSEMEASESARDLFQPGSTFAVGFIVNAVILNYLDDSPRTLHRKLLTSILLKMEPGSLREFVAKELLSDWPSLSASLIFICHRYELLDVKDDIASVTPLGRRCGVHLLDINNHIDIVADAHRRFQQCR